MSTIAPAPLAARYERQVVKTFRQRKATSGPRAQRLKDLGLRDTDHLRSMVAATILRKAGPERFYLHEATWEARDHMSWETVGRLAAGVGIILLGVLAYFLLT